MTVARDHYGDEHTSTLYIEFIILESYDVAIRLVRHLSQSQLYTLFPKKPKHSRIRQTQNQTRIKDLQ